MVAFQLNARNAKTLRTFWRNWRKQRNSQNAVIEAVSILALRPLRAMRLLESRLYYCEFIGPRLLAVRWEISSTEEKLFFQENSAERQCENEWALNQWYLMMRANSMLLRRVKTSVFIKPVTVPVATQHFDKSQSHFLLCTSHCVSRISAFYFSRRGWAN